MQTTAPLTELLGRIPLFRHASEKQLELIAQAMSEQKFARGAVVLRHGSSATRLVVVVEGSLCPAGGTDGSKPTHVAGDFVGELSALEPRPYNGSTLQAAEPTVCYTLEPKALMGKLRLDGELGIVLLRTLSRRVPEETAPAVDPKAESALAADEEPDSSAGGPPLGAKSDQAEIYARELRDLFERERQRATELRESLMGMVRALVSLCETKDPGLTGHGARVARQAQALAKILGWSSQRVSDAALGGLLHDIGNLAIDSSILLKQTRLSGAEWRQIRAHPETGAKIVAEIQPLKHIVPYILHHHEHWDGTGYPQGLAGERISIEGRLIAVADVFDTLISLRPYRTARTVISALAEIQEKAGTQFDPNIAATFVRAHREGRMPAADVGVGC